MKMTSTTRVMFITRRKRIPSTRSKATRRTMSPPTKEARSTAPNEVYGHRRADATVLPIDVETENPSADFTSAKGYDRGLYRSGRRHAQRQSRRLRFRRAAHFERPAVDRHLAGGRRDRRTVVRRHLACGDVGGARGG